MKEMQGQDEASDPADGAECATSPCRPETWQSIQFQSEAMKNQIVATARHIEELDRLSSWLRWQSKAAVPDHIREIIVGAVYGRFLGIQRSGPTW